MSREKASRPQSHEKAQHILDLGLLTCTNLVFHAGGMMMTILVTLTKTCNVPSATLEF